MWDPQLSQLHSLNVDRAAHFVKKHVTSVFCTNISQVPSCRQLKKILLTSFVSITLLHLLLPLCELLQRVACYSSTQGRKSAGNTPHQKTLNFLVPLRRMLIKAVLKCMCTIWPQWSGRQVINISLLTCQHKCIIYVNAVINDVRFNFLRKN